jgi:hypothetical protein
MEKYCVRLKPYDKSKGQKRRDYAIVLAGETAKFIAGDWHRDIHPKLAVYLRDNVKGHWGRDAPPAFDVCTEAEAAAVIGVEKMEKLGRTIEHSAPVEPELPEFAGGTLAHDLNAGDPVHDLELSADPVTELVAEKKPKKKTRKRRASKTTGRRTKK